MLPDVNTGMITLWRACTNVLVVLMAPRRSMPLAGFTVTPILSHATNTWVAIALTLLRTLVLCSALAGAIGCGRFGTPRAVPVDPITGLLDAFETHQVVALGEGLHGNEQAHAFRLALVRHPRFPAVVNDIVVEFGNARYQSIMDRFVRGDQVPYADLRRVWQDTTNANPLFDGPIYEEFFRAVRNVNASLPAGRQLRVLLGGPPIDWDAVITDPGLHPEAGGGDAHALVVIRTEVLSKNRRALAIWGDGHFRRYSKWLGDPEGPARPTLTNLMESVGSTKMLAVWTNTTVELDKMQRNVAFWPVPSLTFVRGTRLGTIDFKYYAGMETDPPTRMQDQFDAILYLGPPAAITFSELPKSLCADAEYTRMRLARLARASGGLSAHDAVAFRKFCAEHLPQEP
jgi:hypothetical protein